MHLFYNRPLAFACALFVVGAACASFLPTLVSILLLILLAALLIAACFCRVRWKRTRVILIRMSLLATLLGILVSTLFFQVRLEKFQKTVNRETVIEGTVLKRTSSLPYASAFDVSLKSLNGEECYADARLECEYASALQVGDRFVISARGRAFQEEEGYDERSHMLSNGKLAIFVCKTSENCTILPEKDRSLRVLFSEWNAELTYRLQRDIGGREGNLSAALLLGNTDVLDASTELSFERTGVSHLLALSGSHIALLIAIFDWILRRLQSPKGLRILIVTVLSFAYLFLTGCEPATSRAVLMYCLVAVSFALRADYDGVTSLFVTLALFILVSPNALYDLGMWMSFVATGAIIIYLPPLEQWLENVRERHIFPKPVFRLLATFCTALFVGVAANLAMTVIQSLAFLNLPLLAVPHTMLLSFPMTWTLLLSVLTLFVPQSAFLCRTTAGMMITVTEYAADPAYILLPIREGLSRALIIALGISLVFLALAKLKSRLWGILPLALFLATVASAFLIYLPSDRVRVEYIYEKSGDMLLFTNAADAVAIDFSDGTATCASALSDALAKAGCTELKDLIISHYHNKTSYYIISMAENIKVRNLHLPFPKTEKERAIAKRLREEGERHGMRVWYECDGLSIHDLEVLYADYALFPSGRHPGLLFSFRIGTEVLTYVNCSIADSTLGEDARLQIADTDYLIVSDTGYSNNSTEPIAPLSRTLDELILADKRALRLFSEIPQRTELIKEPKERVWYFQKS